METKLGKRTAGLALRLGLAGLGLLLWHAPSAKAQECCPDQYTAAELAKVQGSATKPVKLAANKDKQSKSVMATASETSAAPGAKTSRKEKPQNSGAMVAVKQPANSNEKKQ